MVLMAVKVFKLCAQMYFCYAESNIEWYYTKDYFC